MKTNQTFDILFNDENNSNSKGFSLTAEQAIEKANQMLISNESYVSDYTDGTISVVCNETGATIWEKDIKKTEIEKTVEGFENAIVSENAVSWFLDLRTGLGEAEYPKRDFTLDEAIEDQVNMTIE